MKIGIVTFPGSNCDHDVYHVVKHVHAGAPAEYVWHKDRLPAGLDAVILPGGFSYGDYLRCGALARFSPVMEDVVDVREAAAARSSASATASRSSASRGSCPACSCGTPRSSSSASDVTLRVEGGETPLTRGLGGRDAHDAGRARGGELLRGRARRSTGSRARATSCSATWAARRTAPRATSPAIAGGPRRNVVGLMPHPERAAEAILGRDDGRRLFESLLS